MPTKSSAIIKTVLSLYDVFSDSSSINDISDIKIITPDSHSKLYDFYYQGKNLLILFNNNLDDDKSEVADFINNNIEHYDNLLVIKRPDKSGVRMDYRGKNTYLCIASADESRLDVMLSKQHPKISRSTIQKYIQNGFVKVDGKTETQPSKKLKPSSNVELAEPTRNDFSTLKFEVIYKDKNVIVIDKPYGYLSHSKGVLNDEFTVADFFARYTTYNLGTNRPGIVHRLDRDTSGVMLGVLNSETASYIQKQFSNRTVKKTYYAVVKGTLKHQKALIDLPIERNPAKPSQFRVGANGKEAQTEYEVIQTNGKYSLVRLEPKTGRTHQLRVHMSYVGNPIVGDKVYGKPSDRLYLHAARLELTIPTSKRMVFESNIPKSYYELTG